MNDDEFLSQFRKSPRPEFMAALRNSLAQQEAAEDEHPMTTIPTPDLSDPQPAVSVVRPRNRILPLVAACLLMVFIGVALALNTKPAQIPTPLVPMGMPNPAPISSDNAASLHPIAQIGKGSVFEAVWSPDGKWLAMPGSMGIWVYDAEDLSKPLYNAYPEISTYTHLVFSGDSRLMAVDSDHGLRIWNLVEKRDVTPTLKLVPRYVGAIALNSTGMILAVPDEKGLLSFYNTETGGLLLRIKGLAEDAPIFDIEFSPDDKQLVLIGQDTPAFVLRDPSAAWNSADNKTPERLTVEGIDSFQMINYSHDGTRLAGRHGATVVIWDAVTGKLITRLESTAPTGEKAAAEVVGRDMTFSLDNTQIVTLGNQMRLWDIATGTSRTMLGSDSALYYTSMGIIHIKPDWSQVSLVIPGGLVRIHDLRTGKNVATMEDYTLTNIYDLAVSADGTQMMTAGDMRQFLLWDIRDVSHVPDPTLLLGGFEANYYGKQRIAFSPDGQFLTTYRTSGNIQLWTRDAERAQEWTVPTYRSTLDFLTFNGFLAYNADGTRLISAPSDGTRVWLWNTATGKVIQTMGIEEGKQVTFATISPDGKYVAAAVRPVNDTGQAPDFINIDAPIMIYDATTGDLFRQFPGSRAEVRRLAYSPDGGKLLSSAVDGTTIVWDITTGAIVAAFPKMNAMQGITFSPDGTLIAGIECTLDKPGCTLVLWDTVNTANVTRLHEDSFIQSLAFSADGTRIFTALSNGTVRVWGLQ